MRKENICEPAAKWDDSESLVFSSVMREENCSLQQTSEAYSILRKLYICIVSAHFANKYHTGAHTNVRLLNATCSQVA